MYVAYRDAKKAQSELKALNIIREVLMGPLSCLRSGGSSNVVALALQPSGRTATKTIAYGPAASAGSAQTASEPVNGDACRLILGINVFGEDLARYLNGYTYNADDLKLVVGNVNGVPKTLWMEQVNQALSRDDKIAVALDGFDGMDAPTVEAAKAAYVKAYKTGYEAAYNKGPWVATPWEMYRIGFYNRLGDFDWANVDWYFNKVKIDLPKPRWVEDPNVKGQWWPTYD